MTNRPRKLATDSDLSVSRPTVQDGRQFTVIIAGEDITWSIRTREVDQNVSAVSLNPESACRQRAPAGDRQRRRHRYGRCGTSAPWSCPTPTSSSTSPPAARNAARRRCHELRARGIDADYDAILAEMRQRDELDSGRATAPLRPAPDAIHLKSDNLTVEEEVERVLGRLRERIPGISV